MTDTDSGEPDRHRTTNYQNNKTQYEIETLNEKTLSNLFGPRYNSIIFYDFDIAAWNITQYNGERLIYQKIDTIASRIMKRTLEHEPLFKDMEIVGYAISTTNTTSDKFSIIKTPAENNYGTTLIGTIICRNKTNKKIIPFPNKWLTYKNYKHHESIAKNGACEFANFVTANRIFRQKLLSIYTK